MALKAQANLIEKRSEDERVPVKRAKKTCYLLHRWYDKIQQVNAQISN